MSLQSHPRHQSKPRRFLGIPGFEGSELLLLDPTEEDVQAGTPRLDDTYKAKDEHHLIHQHLHIESLYVCQYCYCYCHHRPLLLLSVLLLIFGLRRTYCHDYTPFLSLSIQDWWQYDNIPSIATPLLQFTTPVLLPFIQSILQPAEQCSKPLLVDE